MTLDAEDTPYVTVADTSQDNPALGVQVLLSSSLINVAKHLRDDSLLLLGSKDEPADHVNLLLDDKTYA